jgi:hypothetical protein
MAQLEDEMIIEEETKLQPGWSIELKLVERKSNPFAFLFDL